MSHSGISLLNPNIIFERIKLSEGMKVAEMGCGRTGHFVFSAAKKVGVSGAVYAVDLMKDVLESIKSRAAADGFENVYPVWSDIESVGKTPIPEQSLNACFFVNVMFLLKNKAGAVKEAKRLIKPGGYLVVVDWSKPIGTMGPAPEMMTDAARIGKLAEAEEMDLIEKGEAGDYHYCLIYKKRIG